MAVLGVGGRPELRREAPDAFLIKDAAVDYVNNRVQGFGADYWSGDKVYGLCLPVMGGAFPANPDGYGMYFGSRWYLGPNKTHITSESDTFYKTIAEQYPDGQFGNNAKFYGSPGDVSGGNELQDCIDGEYWVHIDDLGYTSFYSSRCTALAGGLSGRIDLQPVAGNITVAPHGSSDYLNAVWRCVRGIGEYEFSDFRDSTTLASICDSAPLYQSPVAGTSEYNNADLQPRGVNQGEPWPYWQVIADMREWTLDLSAPTIDTTAISEKFGEAVKSLVTGSGSAEFLIDRKCYDDSADNGTMLMKLVLMTEKGCKARAKFYLISEDDDSESYGSIRPGGLYYSAEILVTASAVSVRPADIVAGTVNFATTGAVKLLEAS